MLLGLANKIPIIQSLIYFRWKTHKVAIPKFLILTLLNLSPILAAIIFSPIPNNPKLSFVDHLISKTNHFFSFSEIYIYIATFVSPVMYIVYERYHQQEFDTSYYQKFKSTIRTIYPGYMWTTFLAILLLLFTMGGFAVLKNNPDAFKNTLYFLIVTKLGWYLFFYSLFCFYLSILDGIIDTGNFIEANRLEESHFSEDFSKRLDQQQGNN
ncbi:hypothetical protein EHO58_11030 [Leptospira selangorensis]|uniref:hypothetical protein n=1 Tax=Leptospira selangorensis TaxID=2484982 RepID=UPI00108346DD|nr:hypothetical protein [Leptospira selangorensis]TGK04433.1 hypothetical protein EHO58_11030 [Leptospira selangorensis]